MDRPPSIEFCDSLIAGFAELGVAHACVSPGSRNTPLLLALARQDLIAVSVHHDERSGGFYGLGAAKASGRPVLLVCTSGTAATEYLPAMTEARMAHAPLIALTADRPPELQDRGAPQTINQTNLYGAAAKWFHDTGVPGGDSHDRGREVARRAVGAALDSPTGPVHINIPLREPLVPNALAGSSLDIRAGTVRDAVYPEPAESDVAEVAAAVENSAIAIVAGPASRADIAGAIERAAAALDAIVLADPQSPTRFSGSSSDSLISHGDLITSSSLVEQLPQPDLIIHVGAIHSSKSINQWMAESGARVIQVHDGQWTDPLGIAARVISAEPGAFLTLLGKVAPESDMTVVPSWRRADEVVAAAVDQTISGSSGEAALARSFIESLPPGATALVGSSMPIRLVDAYGSRRTHPARIIANRGANGIDGAIATTLGIAAHTKRRTYALLGDLTALADIGSLPTAARLEVPATFVVINNDGGGIFEFLPQADPNRVASEAFERMIVTPHGTALAPLAEACGVPAATVSSPDELAHLLAQPASGPRLFEVHTERQAGPVERSRIIEMLDRYRFT